MINTYNKYDTVIVKFYFASSKVYKARPAVIISSDYYNSVSRNNIVALAISSQFETKLDFEPEIIDFKNAGLSKPSILKSNIVTVEKDFILQTIGSLEKDDRENLNSLIEKILNKG
jgi:mRNA interferase MazF